MHSEKLHPTFWIAISTFLVSACTSGPQLEKYPRTQIERPYTLPKGVATWTTPTYFSYSKDDSGSSSVPPVPIPLFWQTSLSDAWTLNWAPLPLSLSHQFSYSKEQVWGATLSVGTGYDSSIGFVLLPTAEIYHRYVFGNWAWETTPGVSVAYHTEGDPWEWTAGVGVGPFFQVTSTFSISAKAEFYVDKGYTYVFVRDVTDRSEKIVKFTVPLSVKGGWSFHRQWDLNATYRFNRIGQTRGYTSHIGIVSLVHFW